MVPEELTATRWELQPAFCSISRKCFLELELLKEHIIVFAKVSPQRNIFFAKTSVSG